LNKPDEGVWKILLGDRVLWGEAHIISTGSYLLKANSKKRTPLQIAGDGSPGSPFSIGEAVLVESREGFREWLWPSGEKSCWRRSESRSIAADDKQSSAGMALQHSYVSVRSELAPTKHTGSIADSDAESSCDGDDDLEGSVCGNEKTEESKRELGDLADSDGEASDHNNHPGNSFFESAHDGLAESDAEDSEDDYQPERKCTSSRKARSGRISADLAQVLPDVLRDPEAVSWQQDLETRRVSATEPRSSFSSHRCTQKDIRRLTESSFLGGRPIYDSDGRVSLQLLSAAYRELAAKPEVCYHESPARQILWLAELAKSLGLVNDGQLKTVKHRSQRKASRRPRSPELVCLNAYDRELRFPTHAVTGKRKEAPTEGDDFFQ
jgi:hypothetical protein